MKLDNATIESEIHRVFGNLKAVCQAAGGGLDDVVKLNIYLTDLSHFPTVNQLMAQYFKAPYPARAAIGVRELPRGSRVEMDGVMELGAR
jgi:reactive intermediate/imine deaminase